MAMFNAVIWSLGSVSTEYGGICLAEVRWDPYLFHLMDFDLNDSLLKGGFQMRSRLKIRQLVDL